MGITSAPKMTVLLNREIILALYVDDGMIIAREEKGQEPAKKHTFRVTRACNFFIEFRRTRDEKHEHVYHMPNL